MKGVSVEYPMYFGAKPSIFKLAKELRENETEAEKALWTKLNKNQIFGFQFRRQHPINVFVADFYCPKIKLVIEVDGNIHEILEYEAHDIGRSGVLNDFGITVIRFTNDQILNDLDGTVNQIQITVKELINGTNQSDK
jgi:very-short-patch-repair endonuclease